MQTGTGAPEHGADATKSDATYLALGIRSATRHATSATTVQNGAGTALCNASMPVEVQYLPYRPGGFGGHDPEIATTANVTCKRCRNRLTSTP